MLPNLFTSLARYGGFEEENYLTESFVYLLTILLGRSPEQGIDILNKITGPLPIHPVLNGKQVNIRTQTSLEQGRPDIEIQDSTDTLVYIEIKHDSPLGIGQLESYWNALVSSSRPNRGLVLLTRSRSSAAETTLPSDRYYHICWYEIYNWLDQTQWQDEICLFMVNNFLAFLEEKNMNTKRVSWEYEQGVPSMLNLTNLMEVAAREVLPGVAFKRTGGWSWRGFYLDNAYFFGIRYEQPLLVVFENNFGNGATAKMSLDLQKVHFLALDKDEQFEMVINFLKEGVEKVPKGNTAVSPTQ